MDTKYLDARKRAYDLNSKQFRARTLARFCVAIIFIIQFLSRGAVILWDPSSTKSSRLILLISLPFAVLMTLIIALEYFLFKKKGPGIMKYSHLVDFALFILFIGDWITAVVSNLYRVQMTDPPCFKITALFGLTTFSWRTLLVTFIVQKWYLKMIPPVLATCVAVGFALHYLTISPLWMLIRAAVQLFDLILIIYCEDKLKWALMWTNIQHEKWVQVNNFILNNIPENIMILNVKGETKFISEYCKSFMETCKIPVNNNEEFFQKIRNLNLQQYETIQTNPTNAIQIDKLTTENDLLEAGSDVFRSTKKVETLEDLIYNFKETIIHKKLQERQFLIYNGKLKTEDDDQKEKSIEIKISFVQNLKNEYIILILRDMTQRDLLVALEETNRYKDQLLASVSHELRTPLNGNINLVESAVNSPDISEDIKESLLLPALRSSKFLLHIINDILDMSQIKEKKLRLAFQSGDLKETIKSTAQLVELQAKKKGIELSIEFDKNIPERFCTDHNRLSQIVLNLLNNAIKFTKEGTVKLTVTSLDNESVKISVEDSGIGMSEKSLKKLFSNYTHIEFEERKTMNPSGVGLGLNIAYNLTELLAPKGQQGIQVVSIPNQGSTFTFVVENKEKSLSETVEYPHMENSYNIIVDTPVVKFPRVLPKKQKNKIQRADYEPLFDTCSCPKVLIVDDNPFNTMAFEAISRALQVKCDTVYSGACAIKKLMARENERCNQDCKPYSVIFMDQEMPEMSGAEATREIRRLQGENLISSATRIVGCTAHKSKEEVDRFLEAGLDQCIHKPISNAMIKDILNESF